MAKVIGEKNETDSKNIKAIHGANANSSEKIMELTYITFKQIQQ